MENRPEHSVPAGLIFMGILPVSQQRLHTGFHRAHIRGWLKAGNHMSLPVNDKLGKVPLDIRLFVPVRIRLGKHVFQQRLVGMFFKSGKSFF